jgi:hypothetical protein
MLARRVRYRAMAFPWQGPTLDYSAEAGVAEGVVEWASGLLGQKDEAEAALARHKDKAHGDGFRGRRVNNLGYYMYGN